MRIRIAPIAALTVGAVLALPINARAAEITVWEHEDFRGASTVIDGATSRLDSGWNDRISSFRVDSGMRVLQFGFGDRGAHMYLPHKYESNTVVYTGTHDNDTTPGWWQNSAAPHERESASAYLGEPKDGMHWAMIRAALGSLAQMAVIPLQDVLGLGSEARMNVPSRPDGNWTWRYSSNDLTQDLARKLALIVEVSDRDDLALSADAIRQLSGREAQPFAA